MKFYICLQNIFKCETNLMGNIRYKKYTMVNSIIILRLRAFNNLMELKCINEYNAIILADTNFSKQNFEHYVEYEYEYEYEYYTKNRFYHIHNQIVLEEVTR